MQRSHKSADAFGRTAYEFRRITVGRRIRPLESLSEHPRQSWVCTRLSHTTCRTLESIARRINEELIRQLSSAIFLVKRLIKHAHTFASGSSTFSPCENTRTFRRENSGPTARRVSPFKCWIPFCRTPCEHSQRAPPCEGRGTSLAKGG